MFDLEHAIEEWKKSMRKKRALQDGDLVELESYLRDKVDTLVEKGMTEEEAFKKAEEGFLRADGLDVDYHKARSSAPGRRPPWQAPRFMPPLLLNYFKIASRKLRRQKAYTAIAIGSLALAMAVGFLILLWVHYESSYDRFHRSADSIYRVICHIKSWGSVPWTPNALFFAVKENFPEVRAVSRVVKYRTDATRLESPALIDYKSWYVFVDPAFLSMFDFPLVKGDPQTVLGSPRSVVLTEAAAKKFFGADDPVGKTLLARDAKIPLAVRGVMKDIPETSHLDFDLMMPIADWTIWEPKAPKPDEWESFDPALYIQLAPGADIAALESRLTRLLNEHIPKDEPRISLQRLTDIHLRSDGITGGSYMGRPRTQVSLGQIRIFLGVALIVLLMGMVNYVNLATARSLKRSREIGIRKVTGARKGDIVRQFLGESVLCSLAALGAAVILAAGLGLPLLRRLSGLTFDLSLLPLGRILLESVGLTLAIGLAAGLYPALFVSSFPPQRILKETFVAARPALIHLRRVLVAVQIVCAAVLITVIFVSVLQIRYVDRKDLGFKRASILTIDTPIDRSGLAAFKSELLAHPAIRGVATGFRPLLGPRGHFIQGKDLWWEGKSPETLVLMDWHFVDEDYQRTYGLELLAGRFFSPDFPADKMNYVLNESAVKAMGLADPVGRRFRARGQEGQIIGVIKDFHANTLKARIMPMYFVYASGAFGVSVQFDSRSPAAAVAHIAAVVQKFSPERPLEYTFLDESLRRMYRSERLSAQLLSVFGAVSILISCLGLVGLISLLAEQRTKEIGVRKVLGASVARIIGLMSADFAVLVGLAVVLAAPVGYFLSARWLGVFAYRIPLSWWIFAGSGLLVILLTFAAMSFRILKSARANPVESLRYE
jgi:putative ABC transport system permease protein